MKNEVVLTKYLKLHVLVSFVVRWQLCSKNMIVLQAAREGRKDIVEQRINKLRRHGAQKLRRLNKKDENKLTALHYAVRYGHIEVVKLLIDAGACKFPNLLSLQYKLHIYIKISTSIYDQFRSHPLYLRSRKSLLWRVV